MNTATQMLLTRPGVFCGAQKMSNAERPKGMAAYFMNGMRRPFLLRLLSLRFATSGSVTASMIWPTALTKPIKVRMPSTTTPCVISVGMPDSFEGW